jgi:DNA end-binding protein Ku
MRTIWRGTLSFGLVSIPVGLVVAQTRRPMGFRTISRRTGAPVRQRRWDPVLDAPLERADTVPGYEVAPGRYVTVEPEDLRRLREGEPEDAPSGPPAQAPSADEGPRPEPAPEPSTRRAPLPRTIEVTGFVDPAEVDAALVERAYWLAPDRGGERPYALLTRALDVAGRAGLARMRLGTREHLALVRAADGMLALHTLLYPQDLRRDDQEAIAQRVAAVEVREDELDMAVRLVESLTRPFAAGEHIDAARERVAAHLASLAPAAEAAPAPDAPAGDAPPDLLAALRASLEAATGAAGAGTGRGTARERRG